MIEREVKIRVPDHEALRPLLTAMGATLAGVEHEVNRILDGPDAPLQRGNQVLRVRTAGKNTLTWKGPAASRDPYSHKAREELEVVFADDGAETLLALLARLGFHEVLRYEKRRETWRWQGAVIALDHLAFGDFVEIEGEAGAIQHALHLLHLDGEQIEMRSYAQLQREAQDATHH
jgi:predicted adenylyl cyclase CyaB